MTRLAVLADLHGNLPALEAVQRDLAQFEVDHVVVAGDLVQWGPWSAQVVERVLEAGWAVMRGNNEYYLLEAGTPREPEAWHDRKTFSMLGWLQRQMDGRLRHLIAAWPDSLCLRFADAPPVRVLHGSARSNTEGLYDITPQAEIDAALDGVEETTVIAAHTHLPLARRAGRWRLLNPGSVGVPLDGRHMGRYMLLDGDADGWRPTFRQVPIDPERVLREFERISFRDECGLLADLVIREFRTARLVVGPFMAWRQACRPGAPLTADLLAEYADVDPWAYTPAAYHVNREQ